jgi:UrcA family protein
VSRPSPSVYFVGAMVVAAIAADVILLALPASANPGRELAVATRDLDLERPADRQILERRIARAARDICRRPTHAVEPVSSSRACVADTIARVRLQLDDAAIAPASRPSR